MKESFEGEIIEINTTNDGGEHCTITIEAKISEIRKLDRNPIYKKVKIEIDSEDIANA